MKRSFRKSIAAKLNIVLISIVSLIFLVAGLILGQWLNERLDKRGIAELEQSTRQIVDMVDAYASVLERSADALGAGFAASLPRHWSVDATRTAPAGSTQLPTLKAGDTVINGNHTAVDQFSAATAAAATIFVRQGDDFFRVSTSVRASNGERAIGSALGSEHPARVAVLAGKSYVGRAQLFGREYMTRYTPITDDAGKVVGLSFVGFDFTDSLKALRDRVLSVKVGETGYAFAIDARAQPGLAVIHPSAEGKNLMSVRDRNGVEVVRSLIELKQGVFRYWWQNAEAGETSPREKIAYVATFDRWGWIVSASAYTDEFHREAVAVRHHLLAAGLIVLVAMVLVTLWATNRWISQPLKRALAVTQTVASGDLTLQITVDSEDEVGQLFRSMDDMCQRLRGMVAEIDQGIRGLADDAHRLSQASEAVAGSSGEQSEAATTMAATVEEMTASIHQVAGHAEACRELAESSGQVSDSGMEVIRHAVEGMESIAQTVGKTSTAVATLGHESEHISVIVNVIRDIADQTNLLALNAAIEAARAGESGRGFAVVADEVRKLAERTTKSTEEISRMVTSIQGGASNAVSCMNTGEAQVVDGVRLAHEAGERILSIKAGADKVSQAVTGISEALNEQSAANQEIARNVERIAFQASENFEQARATADTARDMGALSVQLRASIARFKT